MNLLFRIVYAGHASGTHHKLALDALEHLRCQHAELWQRLFLVHAKLYLEGSKAPDNEFKDFKNHVLHTRDGYWGGAPEKVRDWYQHLVEALAQQDWEAAVYSAGVLSHYYTDPLQPFHTGQSEAENNIHRAAEWSISKAYDELAAQGARDFAGLAVDVPSGPNWLAELVCHGAEKANTSYEKLIAHYDIRRGVVDPPAGLDAVARRLIAELLRYAALGFAAVLDRAFEESHAHPPSIPLAAATLKAMAQVPFKLIARRIADVEERRTVERMYDELLATGTVETNLPEDDRTVRDLHAEEVLAKRPPPPPVSKVFPFKPREPSSASTLLRPPLSRTPAARDNVVPLRAPAPPAASRPEEPPRPAVEPDLPAAPPPAEAAPSRPEPETPAVSAEQAPTVPAPASTPRVRGSGLMQQLERLTVAPLPPREASPEAQPPSEPAPPRFHLTLDQDVVDGPAIGPKTAKRLYPHGIKTVRDLMRAEPATLAVLLDNRHITAQTITDWQDQARLVCMVPGLRGTHAQLLVGAGYRSADAIAAADADALCAAVLAFAASKDGQRLLRNGDPPDIEKIKHWLEAARSVKAA